MVRVLQVGLGDLGRRVVRDLGERGHGLVVAAVDVSPELVGRPLTDLVPDTTSPAVVLPSLAEVEGWSSIHAAIVTTTSQLPDCAPLLRALVERGLPVVSTCEELVWPWLRHPELAEELDDVARRSGGRLLGAGVNPGFLMDALPAFLSGACADVRCVRVERLIDAGRRRASFQRKVGAGMAEEELRAGLAAGRLGHVGLGESLHLLATHAGLAIDRWEEHAHPVLAERDLDCAFGPIPRGRVAGIRQTATGYRANALLVELTFHAAVGVEDARDRIVIDGEPPLDVRIAGGVHGDIATSALVIHALDALREAPPGLHTMASVPLVTRGGR
jgi:4-hydroxy-tetrahydrodipicolinate reductase